MSDLYFRKSDLDGFCAACWLIQQGRLRNPDDNERAGRTLHEWARDQVSQGEFDAAVAAQRAMEPEQRGAMIFAVRPLAGVL